MRYAWLTLLLTGLRKGDAMRMRWKHIDDGVLFVPSPKGGRSLKLPLCSYLQESLEPLKEFSADFVLPPPVTCRRR